MNYRDIRGRFIAKFDLTDKILGSVVLIAITITAIATGLDALKGKELHARNIFIAEAAEIEIEEDTTVPILDRIMKAESNGNQFCTEELARTKRYKGCFPGRIGWPLMNTNVDGTTDWGIFQINDWFWGEKAAELGYDILTEEGNRAMGKWIFDNHGTEPWSASKPYWK